MGQPRLFLAVVLLAAVVACSDAQTCNLDFVCFAFPHIGNELQASIGNLKEEIIGLSFFFGNRSPGVQFAVVAAGNAGTAAVTPSFVGSDAAVTDALSDFLDESPLLGTATDDSAALRKCAQMLQGRKGECAIMLYTDGGSSAAAVSVAASIKQKNIAIATIDVTPDGARSLVSIASTPALFSPFTNTAPFSLLVALCNWANVHGDPHISGFDGSRFDFHGEHDKHFALFGRRGGDLVVATVHELTSGQAGKHAAQKKTYFREFGFRPAGTGRQVRVVMHRCPTTSSWKIGAEVDEVATEAFSDGKSSVRMLSDTKASVATKEATYMVQLIWPQKPDTAHLNIDIALTRVPLTSDAFHGVLGMTLNKRLGSTAEVDASSAVDPVAREAALVAKYKVDSLFPQWNTGAAGGVVARLAAPMTASSTASSTD